MDKTANICEGCKSYKLVDYQPERIRGCGIEIPFISNTVKCPCLDCIIKGMCDDMCHRFKLYSRISRMRNTFEKRIKANG